MPQASACPASPASRTRALGRGASSPASAACTAAGPASRSAKRYGVLPATSSYSTAPSDHRSERVSMSSMPPCACSGLM